MTSQLLSYSVLALVLGAGAIVAAQALALIRLKRQLAAQSGEARPVRVSQPTEAELQIKLQAAYEAEIAASVQVFAADLKATSARLGEQVSRLTTTIIEEELAAYQQT